MVYVRNGSAEPARACEPSELAASDPAISADALVAAEPAGPFRPLAVAIESDAAVRDAFARAIPVPSLNAWSRTRLVALGLAALPLLLVLELDRELVSKDIVGGARLVIDGIAFAYVVYELTRKTPRLPAVAAAAFAALAMRWLLVAARTCGRNVHSAVWAAAALAIAATAVVLVRAPTRARLGLELLDKLGISRSAALAARRPAEISNATFAAVIAATGALPLLAWQLRAHDVSLFVQCGLFLAFATAAPRLVRRVAITTRTPLHESRVRVADTLLVVIAGLTLTASLLYGTHEFFDSGVELARCTNKLDAASKKLLVAEAAELAKRIATVRASTPLVLLSVGVVPLVEEQIYRGLLLKTLAQRYGTLYGLFASSLVFGFTHLGIYEIALYQTVLLGIGFGVAYLESGLVAAFLVHAIWNLLNVA